MKPLFTLKKENSKIFNNEIIKYNDHPKRKKLPEKIIPKINCKRGEVLHCSSIHPGRIFKALKSVFPEGNRSVKFFKIPIGRLKGFDLVYFDMNRPGYDFERGKDPESSYDLIEPDLYKEVKEVPTEALSFYRAWKEGGAKSAPAFGKIPHVFIRGEVLVDGLEVIDWCDSK